ncbi:MAG: polyphosphate kinase [Proteobacteria bacterium]|nr:polyphosphate kinase [Pseudomonadota bacterium]
MIRLADLPTGAPENVSEDSVRDETKSLVSRIGELQEMMLAEGRHSLLVVLQGMDTSGKDGTTQKVFGGCDPSGINARGFKKPTDEELAHDFLWRVHPHVPAKGHIQVFNRSHYEDVLITRVHGWIDDDTAAFRFSAINAFENLIDSNDTLILKFFLNISYARQEEKLNRRKTDLVKMFKHNDGDWEERQHWDGYMRAYEDMLNRSEIPWHPVPADQSWYRDYVVAKTIVEAMEQLDLKFPLLEQN